MTQTGYLGRICPVPVKTPHITRRTEDAITQAGFKIVEIDRQSMRGVPTIIRPSIRGIAMKE